MQIPEKIKGRNKIRDAQILTLYVDGVSQHQIGSRLGLSQRRVGQIIWRNIDLLESNKKYEKAKRLNILQRLLNKHPELIGTKSTLDILSQMKDEIEGKDAPEPARVTDRVIIIRELPAQTTNRMEIDGDQDQSRSISGSVSIQRV